MSDGLKVCLDFAVVERVARAICKADGYDYDHDDDLGPSDFRRGYDTLAKAAIAAMQKPELDWARVCVWKYAHDGDSDAFETGCGQTYCFIDGGIDDNKCKYCQYCGGEVHAIKPMQKSVDNRCQEEWDDTGSYPLDLPVGTPAKGVE